MTSDRVVLLSFWRNDVGKDLTRRAEHLLSKLGVARWLWVVGDSSDKTEWALRRIVSGLPEITVLRHDTKIAGDDLPTRLHRLSETANAALDTIGPRDDRIILHESDLRSPGDVVERLWGGPSEAVAGWPILQLGETTVFYDSFIYAANGVRFTNLPPYHAVYRPNERFEVDSVGSCWSFPAWAIRDGARCLDGMAAAGLCAALKARGVRIWVDPTLTIIQPREHWTLHPFDRHAPLPTVSV